jgi:hypothetical protein
MQREVQPPRWEVRVGGGEVEGASGAVIILSPGGVGVGGRVGFSRGGGGGSGAGVGAGFAVAVPGVGACFP